MPKSITIISRCGYDNCDDCGYYEYEDVKVLLNGEEVLHHTGDSHLGGGVWHEWSTAVDEILTSLGYSVKLVEEEEDAA